MNAIEQYWFDGDDVVFPAAYAHNWVGMVWGARATHETWFSAQPEMIHGINFLPITPASIYLGRDADYVQNNCDEVVLEDGGQPDDWIDIRWELLALTDPQTALGHFDADPSYLIRSVRANSEDLLLCDSLARHAVHAAMAGKTNLIIGLWNGTFTHVPIPLAVSDKRRVDPEGRLWTNVLAATGQPLRFH